MACNDVFDSNHDPRGRIVGYGSGGPDDPIYENLGEHLGHDLDGNPTYSKIGTVYRHNGVGFVTGHTGPDGDPLYNGESEAKYDAFGDRIIPPLKTF